MKHCPGIRTVLLGLTCALTLLSCKKDKEPAKTKTQLLTSGSWKMTAMTSDPAMDWDGDGDDETDILGTFEPCQKDNYTTFKPDGTGEDNEGASKCDPSYPSTTVFHWSFEENESKLIIDGDEYDLVELTANTMKVSETFTSGPLTVKAEIIFSH